MRGRIFSGLLLLAIGACLGVALMIAAQAPQEAAFDLYGESQARLFYPGGRLVAHDTIYEACDRGEMVHLYADGFLRRTGLACWR